MTNRLLYVVVLFSCTIVALSSCGPGDSGSYGKSRGGINFQGNDTPAAHLTSVKNHAGFSPLIRTPVCEAAKKDVTSDVYEGSFLRREKLEDGQIFQCNERVRIFADTRNSLLQVIEQCGDAARPGELSFTKTQSTSRYSIVENRLEITDFGTIEISSDGSSMILNHPLSESPVSLRLNEKVVLTSESDHELYTYLCSARD